MTQLDNHRLNGSHSSSKNESKLKEVESTTLIKKTLKPTVTDSKHSRFEQSVVLRQSSLWSRAIIITMIGSACFAIVWACFAKIEQAIPAIGQLKPEGAVKEIQSPVGGVVKEVYVKDGQQVKSGDMLLVFDNSATNAELNSLQKIRTALMQENQIYRQLMQTPTSVVADSKLLNVSLNKEANFLLKSRATLLSENEILRKELKTSDNISGLGTDEKQRLQIAKTELATRSASARLEVEQIKQKLAQNEVQIGDIKDSLAIEESIVDKLKTLSESGAIAQLQYLQQNKKVKNIKAQLTQLRKEDKRLRFDIEQGNQDLKNTVAVFQKNIWEKMTNNKKQIAEIDSQFTKILLENERRLADVNSKIFQSQISIKYQLVRAPVAGTVFNLEANNNGFVARPSQKLLSIVPNDKFIAEVFITNKDIGFIREGMKVDVRIDSFPFSEFGDIKGEITWVGSDALPPDETHRYYRFPTKIKLNRQTLNIKGRNITLQSGMSITANIKVREERSVISLFTELFTKQIDSLKEVR